MTQSKKRVFVIMPFSKTIDEHTEDYWTQHFDWFLKPLIEECEELNAIRSEALHGDILRQIITDLIISPIVVADITDNNPNVYWELGIRHSFKQCTVTVAEYGTKLPFDLSAKGTLFYYPKNHIKNEKFKRDFRKAMQDCIAHPEAPDSPVLETISGRGTLYEIIRRDEATRRVKALASECLDNQTLLEHIYEAIGKRKVTTRFRTSSVELLMTNRYLEETDDFYANIEIYYNYAVSMNERLVNWYLEEAGFEKWLLEAKKDYHDVFDDYGKALQKIQEKLASS